jgi:hypothetical protein
MREYGRVVTTNLHFRLKLVLQDTIKLLYIMLHKRVERFPSERLCELVCPCWAVNGQAYFEWQTRLPTG